MIDTETKTLLTQVKTELAQAGKIRAAVEQLEKEMKAFPGTIEAKLAEVTSRAWDRRGNYRGVFASEGDARGFGLMVLMCCGGNTRAADVLKRDYPQVYERAMGSDPASSGGALVPVEFSSRLQELFERYGAFERNAFPMPMNSDSMNFTQVTGEVNVFLVAENTAGTDSEPDVANISLNAKEWGTLTFYPKSLGEDAAAAIGELVARSLVRAFAKKTDQIGFLGDGTATYFGVKGVVQRLKDQHEDITAPTAGGGLILGAGNLWSELTMADHEKVVGALPDYASDDPKWYCSRTYYWTVMVPLILAAGGVTAEEIEGKRRNTFLGFPVEMTPVMPKTQANSQVPCLFGDLSQAATVGNRRVMTIDESREYKFAERQVTVLGTRRVAINVHNVGDTDEAGPIVGLVTAGS